LSLYGSAYDDVLVSGDFADDLVDGAGADLLRGGKGRDSLQGDEGGLPSSDTVPYDDRVYGGPGGDGIYLGNGDDELETDMEFADGSRVDGGPGVDETYVWSVDVDGRRRLDAVGRIDLGTGRFAMRLGERRRTAVLAGVERLRIPDGHWTVLGTAADETFYGGDAGRDAIEVLARGGDDFVSGTPGDDVLVGGSGRDEAVYVGAGDRVTGFEVVRD
jgi:Ca2+-binding RTX toxin-like protein